MEDGEINMPPTTLLGGKKIMNATNIIQQRMQDSAINGTQKRMQDSAINTPSMTLERKKITGMYGSSKIQITKKKS